MNEKEKIDSVERFTNRIENYVKYRPHYPAEIITFLNDECGFDQSRIVADIGSGPGISCEHFISNGNIVYAVEPNENMRKAAEEIFKDSKNFISVNGTAEATALESHSIDFIIAGQAFHWFDREKCKTEFRRILKNDGYVILMWNDKTASNDFMKSYYDLIKKYGTDYEKINHTNVDDNVIGKFFSPQTFKKKSFIHTHPLDYNGLEGRLLSSSYIPLEGDSSEGMINELRNMFEKYNVNGNIGMEYQTNLYYGKLS